MRGDLSWRRRVKARYNALRKNAYLFLCQRVQEDYRVVLEVLSEQAHVEQEIMKTSLDDDETWLWR